MALVKLEVQFSPCCDCKVLVKDLQDVQDSNPKSPSNFHFLPVHVLLVQDMQDVQDSNPKPLTI
jgi:hypothetical protein